ncbi:hypothetical protein FHW92_003755 [Novosphingobium sp. SG707]|nr:hypothetical protein [Novosphingobium sp. SG707]
MDRDGAIDVLKALRRRFPWLHHVFADGDWTGDRVRDAAAWPRTGNSRPERVRSGYFREYRLFLWR